MKTGFAVSLILLAAAGVAGAQQLPDPRVADLVRAGRVRIAVVRTHASELALSRIVKHAGLVRAESLETAFDLLRVGNVEAFASARRDLVKYSAQMPGSRVLADRYGASFSAIAVPKGHPGRLAYVTEFIEEAKASGVVQRALERAGQGRGD